jgi:hypothetical protein
VRVRECKRRYVKDLQSSKRKKRTIMLNIVLDKADIAVIISVLGIIVAFFNVNRQKRAALKNDEEKFKRDHNLQTYNEFVEILYDLLLTVRKFRSMGNRYKFVIGSNPHDLITSLNELTWEITDSWFTVIEKVGTYYVKREYVLKDFEANIDCISKLTKDLDDKLWKFKTFVWDHDDHLLKINSILEEMEKLGEQSIDEITTLIELLQKKFLGHLYK